jgi:hypothetical protein
MIPKLRIGIFGDSYACMQSNCSNEFNQDGRPWMKILEEDFKRDVSNFGLSGSSIYYSYQKFKENYNQFDKIIFIGTNADRKYCPNLKSKLHISQGIIKKNNLSIPDNEYDIIKNYYNYIHNIKEADDIKELIVEKIKSIKGFNLLYIDILEIEKIRNMERLCKIVNASQDHRWCHLSNKNNFILANKVNNWIDGDSFSLNVTDFEIPTITELKSYYGLT